MKRRYTAHAPEQLDRAESRFNELADEWELLGLPIGQDLHDQIMAETGCTVIEVFGFHLHRRQRAAMGVEAS